MPKTMLVNVTHVEESRVAILSDGILEAYEIETLNREQIKGNIYNAVVENVHPSLEAAFLKISPDLKGFLPLDEVNFNLLPTRGDSRKSGRIGQHLQTGQKIMAQVVREPFSGKPPTVSTYFSLPGRFLVLMPGVDSSGISRKIEDSSQRDRLKKILDELKPPEGFGLIVRTAGLGQTKAELQRDMRYLLRLWQSIQRGSGETQFPGLVYREADLVIRTIRDHLSADIKEVWIDSKDTFDKAQAFARDVMPSRAKLLRLYTGDRPLFNKYNLEEQIESIYKRRVPLESGGEIVIDGTEALTAIDVNSARSKRKGDAEETVTQTNLEAAAEIARQFRLRDLGGLIVIDFIDMNLARNKKKVEEAMRRAMKGDRARHDITRISKMGLVEIARQRLRGAKMGAMYKTCPACDGHGLIKNLEAAALAALRKLQTRGTRGDIGKVRVKLPPDVATWMLNNKRVDLLRIEQRNQVRIEIDPSELLLRHEVEFETFPREKTDVPAPRVVGDRIPAEPPTPEEVAGHSPAPVPPAPSEEAGSAEAKEPSGDAPRPRKRRRRRRRGGSESEAKNGDDAAAEPGDEPEQPVAASVSPSGDSVTEPRAVGETSSAESTDEAGDDGEMPGGKPRRRRRRRRRSRSTDEDASDNGSRVGEKESGPAADVVVPGHVRSDELMPAAVGGRRQGAKRGSTSGGERRRRRGPAKKS
jgi:ribonuclease E